MSTATSKINDSHENRPSKRTRFSSADPTLTHPDNSNSNQATHQPIRAYWLDIVQLLSYARFIIQSEGKQFRTGRVRHLERLRAEELDTFDEPTHLMAGYSIPANYNIKYDTGSLGEQKSVITAGTSAKLVPIDQSEHTTSSSDRDSNHDPSPSSSGLKRNVSSLFTPAEANPFRWRSSSQSPLHRPSPPSLLLTDQALLSTADTSYSPSHPHHPVSSKPRRTLSSLFQTGAGQPFPMDESVKEKSSPSSTGNQDCPVFGFQTARGHSVSAPSKESMRKALDIFPHIEPRSRKLHNADSREAPLPVRCATIQLKRTNLKPMAAPPSRMLSNSATSSYDFNETARVA
ncbi:hypothetical protein KEM48_001154 [Puccinia striiformis f. sp. tritici PST-130]|nr:hypothetical protein KEM48_001154 [Puccinia striiformis f. sp. tritici PST-130]